MRDMHILVFHCVWNSEDTCQEEKENKYSRLRKWKRTDKKAVS